MSEVVFFRAGYPSMLAAWIDGANLYAHLYTNDPALTADRVRADFTPPAYDGYAPLVLGRWTPPLLRGGVAFTLADPAIFTWAGGPLPLPIRGYIATAGKDGPAVWGWRRPGDPFAIGPANPNLIIYARLTFPFPAP